MQLTRRVGTLHSYMTLASSLLILKQSSCLKKKKKIQFTLVLFRPILHTTHFQQWGCWHWAASSRRRTLLLKLEPCSHFAISYSPALAECCSSPPLFLPTYSFPAQLTAVPPSQLRAPWCPKFSGGGT